VLSAAGVTPVLNFFPAQETPPKSTARMPRGAVTRTFAIERLQTAPSPTSAPSPMGQCHGAFYVEATFLCNAECSSGDDSPSSRAREPHPEVERFWVSRTLGAHRVSEMSILGKLARQHWRPKQQLGTMRSCLRGATPAVIYRQIG
jgi:hypothetical protein